MARSRGHGRPGPGPRGAAPGGQGGISSPQPALTQKERRAAQRRAATASTAAVSASDAESAPEMQLRGRLSKPSRPFLRVATRIPPHAAQSSRSAAAAPVGLVAGMCCRARVRHRRRERSPARPSCFQHVTIADRARPTAGCVTLSASRRCRERTWCEAPPRASEYAYADAASCDLLNVGRYFASWLVAHNSSADVAAVACGRSIRATGARWTTAASTSSGAIEPSGALSSTCWSSVTLLFNTRLRSERKKNPESALIGTTEMYLYRDFLDPRLHEI